MAFVMPGEVKNYLYFIHCFFYSSLFFHLLILQDRIVEVPV
jgi:hypothetical protein